MHESNLIRCPQCGELHDPQDMEVAYGFPDAYFRLSETERSRRGEASSDFCRLDDRYFIRSVIPVPVGAGGQIYCWGVWAEVAEQGFFTAYDTWNDDDVSHIPRIPGVLANAVPEYESSLGLTGELELHSERRPSFYLTEPSRFTDDQRNGVTVEDILRYYHYVA